MEKKLLERAKAFLNAHRSQSIWYRVMCVMASLVVFVTTYMLILPAITMEKETYCGLEEHTHTEECYQVLESIPERVLSCDYETLQVHQHTDACYGENHNLICSRAAYVIHTHDANCYNADGILICTLPEIKAHQHTDACYITEQVLVCGQQETVGHTHDSGCYMKEKGGLICGQQEHTHGDGCYDENGQLTCGQQEHTHQDDCYQWEDVLSCGQTEQAGHTHSAGCYETRKTLICGYDKLQVSAHQHGAGCFRTGTAEDVKVLSCGQTEHHHSEVCYQENAAELLLEQEAQNVGLLDEEGLIEDPDMNVPAQADGSLPEAGRAYGPGAAAEETEEISAEAEIIEEAEAETEPEIETEIETETITATSTEKETETEQESETELETQQETETAIETELETQQETEEETETETEALIEGETEAETEILTEEETETETEALTEEETETETLIEETEAETETEDNGGFDTGWYMNGSSWCTVDRVQGGAAKDGNGAAARAKAVRLAKDAGDGQEQGIDFGPYITMSSIAKMVDGNWQESDTFTDGDQVRVQLRYSLPAGKVDSANHKIYYQLPSGFAPNKEETGSVYNLGNPVGTYKIGQDGRIEIEFNDSFATGESFNGTIFFEGFVTAVGTGDESQVRFDGTGSVVTIVRNGSQYDIATAKTGTINTSASGNGTTRVDYTIHTTSKQGTDGKVAIKDEFKQSSASASYVADSFKVYLKDSNGNLSEVTDCAPSFYTNGEYQGFEITGLPELFPGDEYIVNYSAEVSIANLDGSGSISNSAGSGFGSTWSWAWNTVELSKPWIKKEGFYDSNTNQITWNITVNEGKQDISGYTLSDIIPEGLTVDPDSFTIMDSGWTTYDVNELGNLVVASDHKSFAYTFNEECSDTYVLQFKTDAPNENTSVVNTADFTKEGEGDYQASGSAEVTHRDWGIGKWFNGEDTLEGNTIYNWRSEITLPEGPFTEFIYTDEIKDAPNSENVENHYGIASQLDAAIREKLRFTYGNGTVLNFENDQVDFKITYYDKDGKIIEAIDETTHVKKFEITVTPKAGGEATGRKIAIEYPTVVDYSEMAVGETWHFENHASIPGKDTSSSYDYTKPKKFAKLGTQYLNGYQSYYDGDTTVSMTDCKGILQYRLLLRTESGENDNITVTDTIPEGMKLVTDSVAAQKYVNDYYQTNYSGTYDFNADGNVTVYTADQGDGSTVMTVQIKGGYNSGNTGSGCIIAITYQLSIEEDTVWDDLKQESKTYINHAVWEDEKDSQTTTVTRTVEKVSKAGVQLDEDGYPLADDAKPSGQVKYTVIINPGAENLDPYDDTLELTDTLDCTDVSLKLNEVKLYQYDTERGDHLGDEIDRSQYTLKYDDSGAANRVMTLEVPDKRAMVLVYTYQFGSSVTGAVANSISLNGAYSSGTKTEIASQLSGATADRTKVVIYKTNSKDYSVLLSGAGFTLEKRVYDTESETFLWETVSLNSSTTGEDGTITLEGKTDTDTGANHVLEEDTLYRLKETEAPEGYLLSSSYYYFLCMQSSAGAATKDETIKKLKEETPGLFMEDETDLSELTRFFQSSGGDIYVPNDYNEIKVEKVWLDENGTPIAMDNTTDKSVNVQLHQCTKYVDPANVVTVTVILQDSGYTPDQKQYRIAKGTAMSFTLKDKWNANQLGTDFKVATENCSAALSVPDAIGNTQGTVVCSVNQIQGNSCTVTITTSYVGAGLSDTFSGTEPEISVSDDKVYGNEVVLSGTSDNGWSYAWTNLPQTSEDGKDYYYYVEELNPDPSCEVVYMNNGGIQKGIITINNKWIAKENEITIRKEWKDQGLVSRHQPITVELHKKGASGDDAGDEIVEEITLDEDNDWIYHYTLKDDDAEYYVTEKTPGGYTVSYTYNGETYTAAWVQEISAGANDVVVIQNTIQTTSIAAQKKWVDENGAELTEDDLEVWGLTEKEISLHLYGTLSDVKNASESEKEKFFDENGALKNAYRDLDCGAVKVSAAAEWKASWENLPAADEKSGRTYQYFVVEEGEAFAVQYEGNGAAASDSDQERSITVRNVIGKTSIAVDKKWFDKNGTDITENAEAHPETIKVQLYRSTEKNKELSLLSEAEKFGEAVEISAAEKWSHVWEDLEWKDENDKFYYYYVKEENTEGYKPEYNSNGVMEGTIELSNVQLDTTMLTIKKKWRDRAGNDIDDTSEAGVSGVQIQLMRETLEGSFETNFAKVTIVINDLSEEFYARKGAKLKIYLRNAVWSNVSSGDDSGTLVSLGDHKYEIPVNKDLAITGSYNGTDVALETEVQCDASGSTLTEYGVPYTLDSENGWTQVIDNLPKEGIEDGKLVTYAYYAVENDCPDNYFVSYVNNGGIASGTISVVNEEADVETTEIAINKEWLDASGVSMQAPAEIDAVQVDLYRAEVDPGITVKFQITDTNGTVIPGSEVSCSSIQRGSDLKFRLRCNWSAPVNHLGNIKTLTSKCEEQGNGEYLFTIENIQESKEIYAELIDYYNAADWTFSVEPYTPDSSAALKNPVLYRQISLSAKNSWSATVTGLPKSITDNGNTIHYKYYVEENPVPEGFTSTVENNGGIDEGTITIKNQGTGPQKPSITVKKEWEDQENEGLTHPAVEVELFKKGDTEEADASQGTATLSDENGWSHTWTDLSEDANAVYYVKEVSVTGYTTKYVYKDKEYETARDADVRAEAGSVVTVQNTLETTSVKVQKKWVSSDKTEKEAAVYSEMSEITVDLYRVAGENAEKAATVSLGPDKGSEPGYGDGGWSYTWSSLPKGTYYVEETSKAEGYSKVTYEWITESDDGTAEAMEKPEEAIAEGGTILITNIEDSTEISVKKVWSDGNEKHSSDPIQMQLYSSTTPPETEPDNPDPEVTTTDTAITVRVGTWLKNDGSAGSAPNSGNISVKIYPCDQNGNSNGSSVYEGTLSPSGWSVSSGSLTGTVTTDGTKEIKYYKIEFSVGDGDNTISSVTAGNEASPYVVSGDQQAVTVDLTAYLAAEEGEGGETEKTVSLYCVDPVSDSYNTPLAETKIDTTSVQIKVAFAYSVETEASGMTLSGNLEGLTISGPAYIPMNDGISYVVFNVENITESCTLKLNANKAWPKDGRSGECKIIPVSDGTAASGLSKSSNSAAKGSGASANAEQNAGMLLPESKTPVGEPIILSADKNDAGYSENGWMYTWANLPRTDASGNPLYYYIEEISEGNYTKEYAYEFAEDPLKRIKTVTVTNTVPDTPEPVTTSITVRKKWFASNGDSTTKANITKVSFELRQKKFQGGSDCGDTSFGKYDITFDGDWETTINNLPLSETINGTEYTYQYYVVETAVDGETPGEHYTVSYVNNSGASSGEIIIQNTDIASYTLPETGGSGTQPYTIGGLLISAMACLLLYIQNKRRKEETGSS